MDCRDRSRCLPLPSHHKPAPTILLAVAGGRFYNGPCLFQ
jgi:hypothetical protein